MTAIYDKMTVIPDGPSVIPDGVSVIPDGPSVVVDGFSVVVDGPSVVVDGSAPGLPVISLFCCAEKKLHKQIAPYSDIPCWPYRTPCVRTNLRLWFRVSLCSSVSRLAVQRTPKKRKLLARSRSRQKLQHYSTHRPTKVLLLRYHYFNIFCTYRENMDA